ncbi:abortive infection family protein [Shewanella algae]|uniref:abortive infection family protein n=1 Tax=Shewanella algae TaxID=38313 RepID=UPI001C58D46A|nr:abortive infection family protein [Shewanella algae]WKC40851.1 abortive infection family protein [Shewanella algae]
MAIPITDLIIAAISKMVDDSQADNYREPSHSDLEFYINRAGLTHADPKAQGQTIGKAKRVRAVLSWALDNDQNSGGSLVEALVSKVRASGGFRETSENYIGESAILQAIDAFGSEGYLLSSDGELRAKNLESLRGKELTEALQAYALRAKKGAEDAALLSGTGKDLLEATAAHVITTKYGSYPQQANFPALLGQAFIALNLATPEDPPSSTEAPQRVMERGMYHSAVGVNRLRNKEGTGHGRPWIAGITPAEAEAAIEIAGVIAGYMLDKLKNR